MKPNVLKGHSLPFEGRVMLYGRLGSGEGVARCSCGATSDDVLLSIADRKRWHRRHKDAVRTASHGAPS